MTKNHSFIATPFLPPSPTSLILRSYGYKLLGRGGWAREEQALMSLWDGVVMGGGVGISIHGTFRVATETSLFAMPETGSFHLSDTLGSYLVALIFVHHGMVFLCLSRVALIAVHPGMVFGPFESCTDLPCILAWHGFFVPPRGCFMRDRSTGDGPLLQRGRPRDGTATECANTLPQA